MPAHGEVGTMRVAAIVLAAGGSTRLGQPKQLLRSEDEPLVVRAVRAAETVASPPVIVVTGAETHSIEAALQALPLAQAIFNPEWETGMGSSIRTGISALLAVGTPFDAVLLLVCDQPLVRDPLLRQLCAAYRETGKRVIASEYGDTWGVPCLFDRTVLPELAALSGGSGARSIIEAHRRAGDAAAVAFPSGAFDIDTTADWERWQQQSERARDQTL
ncbi:MAG: nucleotidyltransferase family protein [Cytophagales bacterium]|nr:nucleotidyltransferase family protein [Armatimonadota bacterium]